MTTKTISVIPSWESITPLLLDMYERGGDNNRFILSQFMSMARAADKWNEHVTSTKTAPQ
jgi:hypothetical protein